MKIEIPKQLQNIAFRFILIKKGEKVPFEKWADESYRYRYDDQKLVKHIMNGGNYGIVCGYDHLVVLDFDNIKDEIIEDVKKKLGKTFTVKSGSGLGKHLYYRVFGWGKNVVVPFGNDAKKDPYAEKSPQMEVRADNVQVIGPNCIHPSGGRYEVEDDSEIADVNYDTFAEFLKEKGINNENEMDRLIENFTKDQWVVGEGLTIQKVLEKYNINLPIRSGSRLQGPHPIHGSTTGQNFCVDLDKNVWYCFRHGVGGGILSLVAMMEGLITCEDLQQSKTLISDRVKYEKLLQILKDKFGIERKSNGLSFTLQKVWCAADLVLGNDVLGRTLYKAWIVEVRKGNPFILLTTPEKKLVRGMKITTQENKGTEISSLSALSIGKREADKIAKVFGINLKNVEKGSEWSYIVNYLDETNKIFVLDDIVNNEDADPFSLDPWGNMAIELWKRQPYTYNATLKSFYVWNNGIGAYKPMEDEEILGAMIPYISDTPKMIAGLTEVRNKVLAAMKIHGTRVKFEDVSKYWVIFKDKIVDAKTGLAVDVDKKSFFITIALPWKFREDVKDEDWTNIRKMLKDWTSNDKDYKFLIDWLAYNLLPNNILRSFLVVYGPKRTGKSQLQFLIRRIVGQENFATITPSLFTGEDRFGLWHLLNKLSIGLSELDEGVVFKTDKLKAMVAGDPLSIEKKYGGKITAIIPAKLTIFTNYLPEFNTIDDALVDRMHLLYFNNRFPIGPSPVESLADDEIEAFVSYLTQKVLPNLLKRAYFNGAQSDEARLGEYLRQAMPGIAFLNEMCVIDYGKPDAYVTTSEFIARFNEWFVSKYPGRRMPPWTKVKAQISKVLGRDNVSVNTTLNGVTARYILGIRFREMKKRAEGNIYDDIINLSHNPIKISDLTTFLTPKYTKEDILKAVETLKNEKKVFECRPGEIKIL